MSQCDCCRFRSEISTIYDPTCARSFVVTGALNPAYTLDGMSITIPSGSNMIFDGGAGYLRLYRLPHTTISSSGLNVSTTFTIDGTGSTTVTRPTTGKQRLFAFGWAVELDWSDETLRAYSCDDEGVPTGGAWYEQVVTKYYDATNHWNAATIGITVRIQERKLSAGVFRRVISLGSGPGGGVPVASKDFSTAATPFWYGLSGEHLGDDMAFVGGSLACSHSVGLPDSSQSWWQPQLPFIVKLDTVGLGHTPWTTKADHYPDDCFLINGNVGGFMGWSYFREPFTDGGTTWDPQAQLLAANISSNWGISGVIVELKSGSPSSLGRTYFEQGTSNSPKNPNPPGWAFDETASRSLPAFGSPPSNTFTTNLTSFDFEPEGLITPASPP